MRVSEKLFVNKKYSKTTVRGEGFNSKKSYVHKPNVWGNDEIMKYSYDKAMTSQSTLKLKKKTVKKEKTGNGASLNCEQYYNL